MGKLRNTAKICNYIITEGEHCFDANTMDNTLDVKSFVGDFKKCMGEIGFYTTGSVNNVIEKALLTGRTEKFDYCYRFYPYDNVTSRIAVKILLYMLGYIHNDEEKAKIEEDLRHTTDNRLIALADYFNIKRKVEKNTDFKKSDIISLNGRNYEVMSDFSSGYYSDNLEVLDCDSRERKYFNAIEIDDSKLVQRGDGKTSYEKMQEQWNKESEYLETILVPEKVKRVDYVLTNLKEAGMNKNNTLEEYEEQCNLPQKIKQGSWNWWFTIANVKGELHLETKDYELYKHHLLRDFPFLEDENYKGGSVAFYDEKEKEQFRDRYGSIKDEWYEYIREKYMATNCVAVFCEDEMKFVIDAQGYSYARYVFLPCEQTKKISTKDEYAKFGETYKYEFEVDSEGYEVSKYDEKLKQGLIDAIEKILVEKYGLKPIEAKEIKKEVAEVVENVVEEKPKTAKKATKKGGKPKKATKKATKKVADKPVFDIGDELDNGWLIVEYLGKGKYKIIDNEGNELVKTEKEIDEA